MDFERKASADGLTFKLYRGEGVALLAFDLEQEKATNDFVGFSVEVKYPGSPRWGALRNRLHFDYPPNWNGPVPFARPRPRSRSFVGFTCQPRLPKENFSYRVTVKYMDAGGALFDGPSVENAISLAPATVDDFLNVGFTRGFASSQAYADRFENEAGILPPVGAAARANLDHDMAPFDDALQLAGVRGSPPCLHLAR